MSYTETMHTALISIFVMTLSLAAEARVYESFADVAERALPGVVNIRAKSLGEGKDPGQDLYQFFLKGPMPQTTASYAVGSGVVIDKKGHVLTNFHVVKGAAIIEVMFAKSKEKIQATIVGTDPKTDLALLKVANSKNLTPLDLGDSDSLRVGDVVLTIGNPFGYAHTVTSGIISAKGRVIGTGPYDNFLQTDAAIHPGNSGGPLLDFRGRVIGINTAVAEEGPNIGFATPINQAKIVIKDLITFGKVKRSYAGIIGKNILTAEDIDADDAFASGVHGVIVSNLIVEGPGHKAGLKIGDLLMALNEEKILDLNHLQQLLDRKPPGTKIELKTYRRQKGFSVIQIKLGETPKSSELPTDKDIF